MHTNVPAGLPLGWVKSAPDSRSIGFTARPAPANREMIRYDGNGHLLTIARPGPGRGGAG